MARVTQQEVQEVGLSPGQPEGLASVGESVVLAIDDQAGQLGVAVPPRRQAALDPMALEPAGK